MFLCASVELLWFCGVMVSPSPQRRPWLISGLTLIGDQLTKYLVAASFAPGDSLPLLRPILHLTYVQNTGAAFGLFKDQQALFIGMSLLVIAWLIRESVARPPKNSLVMWSYALILGGAAGNLIDRLRFGYVVDFLDLRVWPVFNIGDSAITLGVTLLLWHTLVSSRRHG